MNGFSELQTFPVSHIFASLKTSHRQGNNLCSKKIVSHWLQDVKETTSTSESRDEGPVCLLRSFNNLSSCRQRAAAGNTTWTAMRPVMKMMGMRKKWGEKDIHSGGVLQNIWHWLAPCSRSPLGRALGPFLHSWSIYRHHAKLLVPKLGKASAQRWRSEAIRDASLLRISPRMGHLPFYSVFEQPVFLLPVLIFVNGTKYPRRTAPRDSVWSQSTSMYIMPSSPRSLLLTSPWQAGPVHHCSSESPDQARCQQEKQQERAYQKWMVCKTLHNYSIS